MRLRSRGRVLRRPAMFEPLEARCVLSGLNLEIGHVVDSPETDIAPAATVAGNDRFGGGIDLNSVRRTYGLTGRGQTIAVIDTGVAYDQVALGNGFGNGTRVVGGWDFAEHDADPYDDGPAGFHGTHVAGIIGARSDVYEGIAPGVDLVALRVFDDVGNGSMAWVEQALRWVDSHRSDFRFPITTVNLSLGTPWNSDQPPSWGTLEDEFRSLWDDGVLVVAAAGNAFSQYRAAGLSYPAASPYVLPAGSLNAAGRLSEFSQRHARMVAAPGENIVSTVPDHLFSRDGRNDDWAAASGTSMASPIVAGSAAILREAMGVYGQSVDSPRSLIDLMTSTADTLRDPATGKSYLALDLPAALRALTPQDDFGNTQAAAYDLGLLPNTEQLSGLLATLDDADVFRFRVSTAGQLDIRVSGTNQITPVWTIEDAQGSLQADGTSYGVQPDTNYFLRVAARDRIGMFEATLDYTPQFVDWGTISDATLTTSAGMSSYQFRAARNGIVTLLDETGGGSFRLRTEAGLWKSPLRNRDGNWQLNVSAHAGETFAVQVSSGQPTTLRVSNRVQIARGELRIVDSPGTSRIVVGLGTKLHLSLDGMRYAWRRQQVARVTLSGDGNDELMVYGTRQSEEAIWASGRLQWESDSQSIVADGFGVITMDGASGIDDVLRVTGSSGDDHWTAGPRSATLAYAGGFVTGHAFDRVYFDGGAGNDTATLTGSAGNDTMLGQGTAVRLFGRDYHLRVADVESLTVSSGGGEDDVARVFGAAEADIWQARPGQVDWWWGADRRSMRGFDRYYADGLNGVGDTVDIVGSRSNDRFEVSSARIEVQNDNTFQRIRGWRTANLAGGGGIDDVVRVSGAPLQDWTRAAADRLLGVLRGRRIELRGFDRLYTAAGEDSNDAVLPGMALPSEPLGI